MECNTCGLSHEFKACKECGRETEQVYCKSCGACGISGCCDMTRCERIACQYGDEYIAEHEWINSLCDSLIRALDQAVELSGITIENSRPTVYLDNDSKFPITLPHGEDKELYEFLINKGEIK
jgi:hypothetical protein